MDARRAPAEGPAEGWRDPTSLFPLGAAFVEASSEMYDAPLAPEERVAVAGAVRARRRTFQAGRACAREALARLGLADAVIPVGPKGQPVWPHGTVGAISHCRGYCAAVAASSRRVGGVGLDAEVRRRVDERVAGRACTPAELRRISASGDAAELATIGFSSKEAGFKLLNPLTDDVIRFADAEVDIDRAANTVVLRIVGGRLRGLEARGRFLMLSRVVVVALSVTPGDAAAIAQRAEHVGSAVAGRRQPGGEAGDRPTDWRRDEINGTWPLQTRSQVPRAALGP